MFKLIYSKIKNLFHKKSVEIKRNLNEYVFCETNFAYKWHIRKLTEIGPKYGGGADSNALCGLNISWDLKSKIPDKKYLEYNICNSCYAAYLLIKKEKENK